MYDFNALERRAEDLIEAGRSHDTLKIFLYMADGDPSLDGGYLGMRIGECYERLGELPAAKYWYGRAVEENLEIPRYVEARRRLQDIDIGHLLSHAA